MRLEPRLYEAEPDDLVAIANATDDDVHTLVLVGHEPSMSSTTLMLAGEGSDATALSRVLTKFPTNAIAVLRLNGPWSSLAIGRAVLETFAVPRA
jgi:phosphohistidine phosphatase